MKRAFIFQFGDPLKKLLTSSCLLFCSSGLFAQVTGTKTIGLDYPTLAAAITDLNTNGISGAVTVNIPAAYTETAPTGGYLLGSATLNASTSTTATLTFQKSGAGVDPLLTAPVGTTTTLDGIFTIQGTDYVTINGIDLTESPLNTTATTWMEWGYGLIKLQATAPFDGCQNVTIENCTVTLSRLNTTSVGIYANNHIATSTTALTITAATDAMNNCKFYSNTIQNCNTGISLRGFSAASPYTLYDQNNDIGGSSAGTGNTIQNYCGTTTGSGVNLRYQNNANVAYNTINNTAGSGVASTSVLYGVYAQNGTNASVNITNNTFGLTQGTTSSAVYGVNMAFSGTGTINVNNNTFTVNGGSTGTMYMVYFSGANTTINTNSNDFYNINVATSGSLYFIYHSTAASTAYITCNNNYTSGTTTPYVNKTGSGGTVEGYYNNAGSASGFASINNNNFSNINLAGSPTFYGIQETNGGSGQNKSIQHNTISNITSVGGTQYGISVGYAATENISANTISNLNPGTGTVYGINIISGTTDTIAGNSIHDFTSTGGNLYGIYIGGSTTINIYNDTVYTLSTTGTTGLGYGIWEGATTTLNVYRNKVYDIAAAGTGSSVNGMYLNSGAVTVYNNVVGDLRTPNYNGAGGTQLVGIYLGGGSSYLCYYNTVYLNGTSTGIDFGSCAVFASSTPPVTLRNNIFVNTSIPNGAGLTVAFRRSTATLTTYQAASNNNLFYAGTLGPSNVIFYDGTTPYTTLAALKALVTPRDGNSVTENPSFLSTTGSSANFLYISTTIPTQVESGAVNIPGITIDIVGTVRAGNPAYAGTGSAPDIGAVEGNYIVNDLSAPNITYTLLSNACTTGDRTVTSAITDASGVPISGTLMPRIYFMKGAGPWFSAPGALTSGTATNGTWSFTISAAAMGGLVIGDIVSYFIIAQDVVATPNVGSNPSLGLVATGVNTISSYPTTPNTFTVIPTLSGTYNVGVGMAYTTITAAVNAYNNSCISGPVVFQLTDATYSTSETFPITINANAATSAVNTLIIKPAPGISPTISGSSSSGIFVLNGADYVTIDGTNGAVINSICPRITASRDMTIMNTSTSTSSAVVWIQTATGSDGATNNTIRNCNIAGSGNTRTLFGIGSGGTSVSYTSLGIGNNNNRIENDSITDAQSGIYSMGASASNKNTGTVISQNLLNAPSPDNLRNNGIITGYEDGIVITANHIANITNSVSTDIIGISAGFGNNSVNTTMNTGSDVTNAIITYNRLDNLTQTNTFAMAGIAVAAVTSGTTTVANNMISGVISNGTGGDFSTGIFIGGAVGSTTNVFYNSVDISGTVTGGSTGCYAISIGGTNPVVNMKDNIFVNNGNPGPASIVRAVGLAYSTYSNLSSDHNDFYSIGTNLGMVGSLSGGTAEATLTAWQSATSDDANSVNVNPVFTSPTDLHLTAVGANLPMNNTGTPVVVTTDYDCNARSLTTPDMGINEFNVPPCSSVTAGTITAGTSAFCGSGATSITVTGASSALGITYQWRSSTDGVTWNTISGATTTVFTISPAITTTTIYRFVVTCSFSGVSDSVSTTITINPFPVIAVTPDGGGYCSGPSGSVTMTASGATTYSWAPATGLSTTTGATVIANPTATTVYVVTGTDAVGCSGIHTSTVVVTPTPPAVTVTPATDTICSGNSVTLTASASLPANIFSDDFNSGLGAWVIDNTGSTSTAAIPNTQWTARPNGYAYSSDIFHSPDASQFVMSNSDPGGSGSTTHSMLISPSFSLAGYSAANLAFQLYYRYIGATDQAKVEISTDGGTSWTLLINYTAAGASAGSAASFNAVSISLAPYLGNSNCKIRFNFQSSWGWYWAIDNVAITGSGAYTNITWSPSAGLYNDAALTSPYTGAIATTVYAAPVATTIPTVNTYIATSTNGGCTNTGSSVITVNPLPNAGSIVGPSNVCPGLSITLLDGVAGGVWSSSNASATVSGTGIVTGAFAGTDTISYAVTNLCGTGVTTFTITVNPLPDAGSIIGLSHVCGGGATITLNESAPGGVWSSSNPAAATVSATGVVTGVSAGLDTISYAVTNVCGTATTIQAITVDTAAYAGVITGTSLTVCAGSSIVLTDTIPGGVWSADSTIAAVSPTGVVTGLSAGTAIITYAVTNGCGTANAVIPIVINPTPVVFNVTGGGTYCAGSGGVHVGLSGSEFGTSYQLFMGSTPLSAPVGSGSAIDFGLETAAGTYTVFATSSAGCTSDMAGSATVIVNPTTPPVVAISANTGDTVCVGTVTTFNAVTLYGGETPAYQWMVNGVVVSNLSMYTYLPANGDVVTVTVTSSSCASPDTASSTATMTVVPYATPSVSITASPGSSACLGSPVTFTATPVFGGAAPLLRWTVNGVNVATGLTFTYAPANGDVVYCALFSSFPCILVDSVFSNSITMTIDSPLYPSVVIVAHPGTVITTGQSDTLIAIVTNGGSSPTYQWAINGTNVPGATSATFISSSFSGHDSVSCTVASSGVCGGIITFNWVYINVNSVGVTQITAAASDIRLMPNPNKGTFTVVGTLATTADANVSIEITDMLGQVIYKKEVIAKSGVLNEQIILNNTIANGMYMLNLHSGNEHSVFHFVVEQ